MKTILHVITLSLLATGSQAFAHSGQSASHGGPAGQPGQPAYVAPDWEAADRAEAALAERRARWHAQKKTYIQGTWVDAVNVVDPENTYVRCNTPTQDTWCPVGGSKYSECYYECKAESSGGKGGSAHRNTRCWNNCLARDY